MPYQVIVTDGLLSDEAQQKVFAELTDLLLDLHGLGGNEFMTPNVIGEVTVVPKGKTFSGGKPADIAVIELKVPSFVLTDPEAKKAWVKSSTDILHAAAEGRLSRDRIYASVTYAVEGSWGIGGTAYDNAELGEAISGRLAA
jgi:phenylpyruvate tautomerase PptA (4-oxalocrotonate tautomerase family)